MITICTSEGSFGETFFFRQTEVFWLPFKDSRSDYLLHSHTDNLNSEKWFSVSANVLTQWSDEE